MPASAMPATFRETLPSPRQMMDDLNHAGWANGGVLVDWQMLAKLQDGLHEAYRICRSVQVKNGLAEGTDGTAHHLLACDPVFLEFLETLPLHGTMQAFFGGNYVLNSYGGVINRKDTRAYVANVHRDVRFHTHGIPLMINMIVLLDDFTLENGATYFLSGSHHEEDKPSDERFYREADRLVAPAGTIALFDSNLWHAAGTNTTDRERNALTLTFTRPFFKPQMDYPRLLGYDDAHRFAPEVAQILGYNARVPSTLEEWYQPPATRFYKPGQG